MIHFNFIVDDVDAENIFECINAEINRCHKRKLLSDITKEESDWFDRHIIYLNMLKIKMKNSRDDEGGTDGN